jgi:DNA-binding transcriptional ArsR family regulator
MAANQTNAPDGAGQHPTGWSVVAESDAVVDIIDALLDLPPHREFNKSELAEFAGVSRKSVHTHLDLLLALGLITEVEGTTPTRYRFDPENDITQKIIELDAAVNRAGPEADNKSCDTNSR